MAVVYRAACVLLAICGAGCYCGPCCGPYCTYSQPCCQCSQPQPCVTTCGQSCPAYGLQSGYQLNYFQQTLSRPTCPQCGSQTSLATMAAPTVDPAGAMPSSRQHLTAYSVPRNGQGEEPQQNPGQAGPTIQQPAGSAQSGDNGTVEQLRRVRLLQQAECARLAELTSRYNEIACRLGLRPLSPCLPIVVQ
jgi:hypothetical protein